jgi:hypothetical protein
MKRLFFILAVFTFFSCEQYKNESLTKYGYDITVIEGCEYLEVDGGVGKSSVYSITHKGNCKNHKQ